MTHIALILQHFAFESIASPGMRFEKISTGGVEGVGTTSVEHV